jgi:hypothetical protein
MDKTLTISDAGSLLMGAGLAKIGDGYLGLYLIGVGVILKITVAVLQKYGVPVEANPQG